jgi:IS30 family transposase
MRRSRPVDPNGDRRGHIKDIVSIRQRPAAVEDRAVPGHWEGDLLSGPNNSYIATLVERHTRYVMLAKVAGKDTRTVVTALIKHAKKLPKELYKSLTWDRGKELTDHRRFTLATKIDVFHSRSTSTSGASKISDQGFFGIAAAVVVVMSVLFGRHVGNKFRPAASNR